MGIFTAGATLFTTRHMPRVDDSRRRLGSLPGGGVADYKNTVTTPLPPCPLHHRALTSPSPFSPFFATNRPAKHACRSRSLEYLQGFGGGVDDSRRRLGSLPGEDRVIFKFRDFEMTLTLEEINYFTNLIYQGRGQIIPYSQSGKKFLRYLGLKNTKELWCFENNWVSLDYLYERYDYRDGYKLFKNEFSCTPDHWQARRPIAFVVALVRTLIFPFEHEKISICICSVARAFFE
ncbi:hypothetical protein RND71_015939 [Anisodus tanguticus]|uniref:Uncharacterized protein n=1 Tax=Anisodus tanguticus TaxID=243964 RepID=A0AAE1S8Y0_9SOLA|nr:hypothetical protein RND71_015939 [Anisodus tanguticus]